MSSTPTLWDDAAESAEQAEADRRIALARVASIHLWPYLVGARDATEFGQRLDLVEPDLTKAAALAQVPVTDLVTEYTRQHGLVLEAAAKDAATRCACGHKSVHHADGGQCPTCGCQQFRPTVQAAKQADKNVWGTDKADVGEGYCPDCEREDSANGNRQHYYNCPQHRNNRAKEGAKATPCPDCGGTRAVPAGGHEPYHEVSNGYVRCPTCVGHGVVHDDPGEPDERTSYERWGDVGDGYGDLGDAQDRWYKGDYLASLKTALEEGEDPLDWLEQEGEGQGTPEKPGGHTTTSEASKGTSPF